MLIGINLGCGYSPKKSNQEQVWTNLDKNPNTCPDKLVDLESGLLPFPSNSVDLITADSVLEHLRNLIPLVNECWRILKPSGVFDITVPEFPSPSSVMDPDHKRFFVKDSFSYFQVPADGRNIHDYLSNFWHCSVTAANDIIYAKLYPNKEGNPRFPYQPVKGFKDE